MQKYRTAAAGDPGAGVVGELDHQVIEVILAPEPIASFIGRPAEGPVVAAIRGVLAPG
jgi:hypothetical protein